MDIVLDIQRYLYLALGFLALGIELWALADCLRRSPASFEASFKRTKGFWAGLTGAAAGVGLLTALFGGGGLFGLMQLAAVIAASVYLADVKPALSEIRGSGSHGPYGPW